MRLGLLALLNQPFIETLTLPPDRLAGLTASPQANPNDSLVGRLTKDLLDMRSGALDAAHRHKDGSGPLFGKLRFPILDHLSTSVMRVELRGPGDG